MKITTVDTNGNKLELSYMARGSVKIIQELLKSLADPYKTTYYSTDHTT